MTRTVRVALAAVGIPVVFAAVFAVLAIVSLPRLPERVVVHWSATGPDGDGSPLVFVGLIVGIGVVVPALTGLFAVLPTRAPFVVQRKALALFSTIVTVALTATLLVALLAQEASDPLPGELGWGVPLVVALAVLAALVLLPRAQSHDPRAHAVPAVERGATERISWLGEARASGPLVAVFGIIAAALAVLGIAMTALGAPGGWVVLVVSVVVAIALASTVAFSVTVDDRGLRVRSALGVPRFRIPLEQITAVRVTSVLPIGDFGGWGVRFTRARWGVLVRSGEALDVERAGRPGFVVTVPHAATAASVLQALLDARQR